MTAYRFMVRIVANAKCVILSPTAEDSLNRVTEVEFDTYDEAMALVGSGMKTAWAAVSEWRGEGWDAHCVITGTERKRIKYFDVFATKVGGRFGLDTVHVSHHDRKPDGVVTTIITDPATLSPAAEPVEVTADPVTVAAAALPVCEDPQLVRYDVGRTFPVKTRAGAPLQSHFSCGAWALAARVDQLVDDIARDRLNLARLNLDGRRTWRRDQLADWIAQAEARAVGMVTRWAADPPVCTCRDRPPQVAAA